MKRHISDAAVENLQSLLDGCRSMARLDAEIATAQDRVEDLQPWEVAALLDSLRTAVRQFNTGMLGMVEVFIDLAAAETLPGLPAGDGANN